MYKIVLYEYEYYYRLPNTGMNKRNEIFFACDMLGRRKIWTTTGLKKITVNYNIRTIINRTVMTPAGAYPRFSF